MQRFTPLVLAGLLAPVPGRAALEIVLEEITLPTSSELRATWSGSLDTQGLGWQSFSTLSIAGGMSPNSGGFFGYFMGGSPIALSLSNSLNPALISFSPSGYQTSQRFSGQPFGLDGSGRIGVPAGYTSGSPLNGSITFQNRNFLAFGIHRPAGPHVWTLTNPAHDTITMRFSEQTIIHETFETAGANGDIVPPLTYGDLTITITDQAGGDKEPRVLTYGDTNYFSFVGPSQGTPSDTSAVSYSHYIASTLPTGGAAGFDTMDFAFSKPVRKVAMSTIDMMEAVNGSSPLVLSALDASGAVIAQTVISDPGAPTNGGVLPIEVETAGNLIHKVRLEGPWTGHGLDDVWVTLDPGPPPPPAGELVAIAPPAGWDSVEVTDMSDDGTQLVGRLFRASDFSRQAFLWSESGGFTLLDGLPGTGTDGIAGISGDGNVVLGWTPSDTDTNRNDSWVYRSGTTTAVPWISGTEYNASAVISTDGSVLGGSCDVDLSPTTWATRPASWTWNGSSYTGSNLPAGWPAVTELQDFGWIEAVSGDGRYLFGKRVVQTGPTFYHAYRFDRVDGSIDNLGSPNNLNLVQSNADGSLLLCYRALSYAYLWEPGQAAQLLPYRAAEGWTGYDYAPVGMSEAADRIIGVENRMSLGTWLGSRLVLWDENHDLHGFLGFVEAQNVDLSNWTLDSLAAISADGRVIAGEGTQSGANVAFLLKLPAGPLPANPVEALLTGTDGFFDPADGDAVTGLESDGDGDGVANVVEIALGVMDGGGTVTMNDPADPASQPAIDATVDDPATPQLAVTVIRRHDITGLTVRMVCTADPGGVWDGSGVTETVVPIDDTWEQVTFTAPAGGACQFGRLVVEYTE